MSYYKPLSGIELERLHKDVSSLVKRMPIIVCGALNWQSDKVELHHWRYGGIESHMVIQTEPNYCMSAYQQDTFIITQITPNEWSPILSNCLSLYINAVFQKYFSPTIRTDVEQGYYGPQVSMPEHAALFRYLIMWAARELATIWPFGLRKQLNNTSTIHMTMKGEELNWPGRAIIDEFITRSIIDLLNDHVSFLHYTLNQYQLLPTSTQILQYIRDQTCSKQPTL